MWEYQIEARSQRNVTAVPERDQLCGIRKFVLIDRKYRVDVTERQKHGCPHSECPTGNAFFLSDLETTVTLLPDFHVIELTAAEGCRGCQK